MSASFSLWSFHRGGGPGRKEKGEEEREYWLTVHHLGGRSSESPPFLGSMIPLRPPAREIDPSMIGYQGSGFGFGGSGERGKKEGEREKSSMEFALLQQRGGGGGEKGPACVYVRAHSWVLQHCCVYLRTYANIRRASAQEPFLSLVSHFAFFLFPRRRRLMSARRRSV